MAGIGNYSKGKKFALKSGNKTSFKMMGSTAYKKDEGDKLPEGFYDSYKAADQKNVDGKTINMQQTKAASVKSGKFTPVYS